MRSVLAVSEYTIQLALIFASGIVALLVKGKAKVAAQRRFRNRRALDRVGVNPPALGCMYQATVNTDADGFLVRTKWTSAIVTPPPPAAFQDITSGGAGTTVTRVDAYTLDFRMDITCGADDLVIIDAGQMPDFGPNVIPQQTCIRLDVVN